MAAMKQYLVELDEPYSVSEEAGRGAYGAVYKSRVNGAKCVVKKLHDILTGSGSHQYVSENQWRGVVEKFIREIELLSQQRHPNIVQFLGVCNIDGDPRDICLVMEQLDIDLKGFIESNKSNISLSMKLSILKDVSCGVSHLHANGIIHRDLNAGNVLLSVGLQAKVADLGVSRIIDSPRPFTQYLSRVPGALDYMPPETLQRKPKYGFEMDSFSFGHLALYLVIETYPHPKELIGDDIDLRKDKDGQLLCSLQIQKRKEWIPRLGENHPLESMIKRCLHDIPARRPSMKKLREQLAEMMERHGAVPSVTALSLMNNEKDQKISTLTSQIEVDQQEKVKNMEKKIVHLQQELKLQLTEKDKLAAGQQAMKRKLERDLLEYQKEADSHIRQMSQRNTQLQNEVMVLNDSLSHAWAKYDALIFSRIDQPSTQHHFHEASDQSNVSHHPNDHYSDSMTNQADRRLKEAEEARKQFEQKRHTARINHTPQQQMPNRTSYAYQQMTGHPSHTPQQQMPAVTHRTNDIHENPIIQDIDDEIQQYANEVRRDTQPQTFTSDNGQSIPYDPNLTCDGCGKQFRYGEIQKLRRHIHELCIAREHI